VPHLGVLLLTDAPVTVVLMSERADDMRKLLLDETGQDLIEYALVAALIGVGAILALKNLSTHIGISFSSVSSTLSSSV
jgi:pilus assembly protein Flp/PilA